MRFLLILLFCFPLIIKGQTIGGNAVYNFLKLPSSPLQSASGGVNVSLKTRDAGFAFNNPSLIDSSQDRLASVNFNAFFAGVKSYQLATIFDHAKLNTTFGAALVYNSYGNIPMTDPVGNETGSFRPHDLVFILSGSRSYLEKWRYGVNLKFISSSYQQYKSSAIAFDFGISFHDTARLFSAGLVAKNMGFQLKAFDETKEDLPFDLEVGLTKKLEKAPFGFSVSVQQLHRFNTEYNDTVFNNNNAFPHKSTFSSKLINHFILAAHVYAGQNLEFHLGYNFLRRSELNLGTAGNGLNGFSAGFKAKFSRFQFQYARAYYQQNSAYNQLGINLDLQKIFGIGAL